MLSLIPAFCSRSGLLSEFLFAKNLKRQNSQVHAFVKLQFEEKLVRAPFGFDTFILGGSFKKVFKIPRPYAIGQ